MRENSCLSLSHSALLIPSLLQPLWQNHQCALFVLCLQEAAKGLQEQLGDPSALVLMGSPEQGKVAIVVSVSGSAVKRV